MNHKLTLGALAATSFLALSGASFATDISGHENANPADTSTSKSTNMATATVTKGVPFKGTVESFKTGTDGKSIIVQNKDGEWFTLNFGKECKAIEGAKSVQLTQTDDSTNGWVYVGKAHCKVASFAKTNAPEGNSAMAPTGASPNTTNAVAPHSDHH